jgi:AAA+ superfamily predicted ATPase
MIKHAEQWDNKKVEVQVIETGAIAATKVSTFVEEPVRYGLQAPWGLLLFGLPGRGKSTSKSSCL